jgi:iron complex transport system substrate-binding protein
MQRFARILAPLFLSTIVVACGGGGSPQSASEPTGSPFPLTVTDDNGVRVTLEHPPRRIVTFGPSLTETLFALGAGDRVVGVSGPSDDFPPAARSIEEIGAGEFGVEPNVEKVVSLRPDLFLYAFTGTPGWMSRLRELHIPVFTLLADDFNDALHDIDTVGAITGIPERAADLVGRIRDRERHIVRQVRAVRPVSCFFETGYTPPVYTVGPGSLIYDLLQRAGCDPVTKGLGSAYPQLSVEAVVEDDPSVYLVASDAARSVSSVTNRPGYDAISAVQHHRVFIVNADLVTRPGPRMPQGLSILARALHPEVFS